MNQSRFLSTRRIIWISLFAALMAVGSWISLPIGPVPIALQSFFVMLAGLILGPRAGFLAVLLFVGVGCLGLPVFTGGKGGLGVLFGPTGGYLMGYFLLAPLSGISHIFKKQEGRFTWGMAAAGCTMGTLLLYTIGTARLASVLDIGAWAALSAGVLPFLIGDVLKIAAALGAYKALAHHRLLPA